MFCQTSLTKLQVLSIISLACIVFLTACNGGATDTPVSTNTLEPLPTDTLVPTPTNTPEPPVVEINPDTDVELNPGDTLPLQAIASGTGTITYRWELVGVGSLSEETDKPAVLYTAPESVEKSGNAAVVSIIVRNEGGETTKGVSISIVAPTLAEAPTKEPTKAPTKEPSPEPTVETVATPPVDGECPFDEIPFRNPIEGPSVDVQANITSIPNCADNLPTASAIPLIGAYSGDFTNKELWILVYPPDGQIYPQSANACADERAERSAQFITNEQWKEVIRLGRPGVPEAFHIVAVVTDVGSPASEAFHQYLADGCAGNWGSVPLIPPGATELDSIVVHTR